MLLRFLRCPAPLALLVLLAPLGPCIARFEGAIGVKAAAMSVREKPQLTLKQKNIMGVVVPEIEATKVQKNLAERGYGVLGTSAVIDETASAFEELVY